MTRAVEFAYSRTFPAGVKRAFDEVLPAQLDQVFDTRVGALPPITGVRDQPATWGTPGQTRTILMRGGSMRERLTEVNQPKRFAYHLDELTGPMKMLIRSLDGAWEFEKAGTGVRITWRWRVHPRGRVGELGMPGLRRMWEAYCRRNFDNLERLLVR
jgi:hypothetical protein